MGLEAVQGSAVVQLEQALERAATAQAEALLGILGPMKGLFTGPPTQLAQHTVDPLPPSPLLVSFHSIVGYLIF